MTSKEVRVVHPYLTQLISDVRDEERLALQYTRSTKACAFFFKAYAFFFKFAHLVLRSFFRLNILLCFQRARKKGVGGHRNERGIVTPAPRLPTIAHTHTHTHTHVYGYIIYGIWWWCVPSFYCNHPISSSNGIFG